MVFNKIDLIDKKKLKELKSLFNGKDVVWVSVYDQSGIDELKKMIQAKLA